MTPMEKIFAECAPAANPEQLHRRALLLESERACDEWRGLIVASVRAGVYALVAGAAWALVLCAAFWMPFHGVGIAFLVASGVKILYRLRARRTREMRDVAEGRALQTQRCLEMLLDLDRTARFHNEVKPCAPFPNGATQASRPPAGTKEWN